MTAERDELHRELLSAGFWSPPLIAVLEQCGPEMAAEHLSAMAADDH